MGSLLHTTPPTPSHFPVPFACWERVWLSLPLVLRAPNKASRRSNCFSFVNCVVCPTLISKVRTGEGAQGGLAGRLFRSSSLGEQGGNYLLSRTCGTEEGQRAVSRAVKSRRHCPSPLHLGTDFTVYRVGLHPMVYIPLRVGHSTCPHPNF